MKNLLVLLLLIFFSLSLRAEELRTIAQATDQELEGEATCISHYMLGSHSVVLKKVLDESLVQQKIKISVKVDEGMGKFHKLQDTETFYEIKTPFFIDVNSIGKTQLRVSGESDISRDTKRLKVVVKDLQTEKEENSLMNKVQVINLMKLEFSSLPADHRFRKKGRYPKKVLNMMGQSLVKIENENAMVMLVVYRSCSMIQ